MPVGHPIALSAAARICGTPATLDRRTCFERSAVYLHRTKGSRVCQAQTFPGSKRSRIVALPTNHQAPDAQRWTGQDHAVGRSARELVSCTPQAAHEQQLERRFQHLPWVPQVSLRQSDPAGPMNRGPQPQLESETLHLAGTGQRARRHRGRSRSYARQRAIRGDAQASRTVGPRSEVADRRRRYLPPSPPPADPEATRTSRWAGR